VDTSVDLGYSIGMLLFAIAGLGILLVSIACFRSWELRFEAKEDARLAHNLRPPPPPAPPGAPPPLTFALLAR